MVAAIASGLSITISTRAPFNHAIIIGIAA
jgi:hypothetical protein